MKIPFRRDTAAERRKTLEAASVAAAELARLRSERQAALLDSEIDAIEKHDNAIAAQERRIATLQEKLRLLTEEQKRERHDQRESDRQAAIKTIESKLKKREALATELEAAIKKMEECYFALIEFPGIAADWPFPRRPGFGRIDLRGIQKEVAWAMYSAGRPFGGKSRLPAGESLDLGVSGIKPESISGLIIRENRQIIESLQIAHIGRDDEFEENAA